MLQRLAVLTGVVLLGVVLSALLVGPSFAVIFSSGPAPVGTTGAPTTASSGCLLVIELDGSPGVTCVQSLTVPNDTITDNGNGSVSLAIGTGAGTGDASTNTSTSVDNELVLFSGTAGKTLKRATTTGLLKGTAGVLSAAVAGTDYQAPLGFTAVPTTTSLTIAGTSGELVSSAGSQDLSVSRTWTLALPSLVSLASKGLLLPSGTAAPGTCTVGQIFFDTDATAGQNLYGCTSTNTWTLEAGGGVGGTLEVKEVDSAPDVTSVTLLTVPNGSLTNNGSGSITLSYPTLTGANVFSSATGQQMKKLLLDGSTSGTLTLQAAAVAGTNTLTWPAGTTDFSATGGTSQVVKQLTLGGALTVGVLSSTDVGLGNVDNTSDATKNSATAILTNKQVEPRTVTCTPASDIITPNADTTDVCEYYTLAAPTTIANPTATGSNPRSHQRLELALKSAAPQALTFGTNYDTTCGLPLPVGTTGDGTTVDHFLFSYNPNSAKFCLLATSKAPARRVTTLASATTVTCPFLTSDQCDMQMTGATGTLTVAAPTGGTPDNGTQLTYDFLCTNSQTFAWNAIFLASPTTALPTTCPANTTQWTRVDFWYSTVLSKWEIRGAGGSVGLTGTTGSVMLPMGAVQFPATDMAVLDSSGNNPRLLFDATVASWCAWWAFRMPPDYTSTPVLKFPYTMASAITGGVVIDVALMAVTPGDAVLAETDDYATVNTCIDTVPETTAGRPKEISCALTNTDSLAAGDLVRLKVCRNIAHASDTASGNLQGVAAATLEYTR